VYSTTGIVYTWSYVVLVHDWMLLGSAAGYSISVSLVLDARHSSVTVCWLMAIWMHWTMYQCVSCGGCWMAMSMTTSTIHCTLGAWISSADTCPCDSRDPARQRAASRRVHVGSLLTRETAESAPSDDGTTSPKCYIPRSHSRRGHRRKRRLRTAIVVPARVGASI